MPDDAYNSRIIENAFIDSDLGIILINENKQITFVNKWMESTSLCSGDDLLGKTLAEAFDGQLSPRLIRAVDSAIDNGRNSVLSQKLNKSPFPLYKGDGERQLGQKLQQLIYVKTISDAYDNNYCMVEIFDVTEAVRREKSLIELGEKSRLAAEQLSIEEAKMRAILNSAKDCIITLDENGIIQTLNEYTETVFQCKKEQLYDKSMATILSPDMPAGLSRFTDMSGLLEYTSKLSEAVELKAVRCVDEVIDIDLTVSRIRTEEENSYVAIIRDITERKKAEARLHYLAKYDPLTGLANRALFHERLEHAIQVAKRENQIFPVLFLDIDRFKNLNDTLGHDTGDAILKVVSRRIKGSLREVDTVCRMGGDEFVIIIETIHSVNEVSRIAEKIIENISKPIRIEHNELFVTVSIGIAIYPDDGDDYTAIFKNADLAMYEAKDEGRNNFQFFSQAMNERIQRRMSMESDLRKAIAENQFVLYYQPQVDINKRCINSCEALIRWIHPDKGNIPPFEFIPLAEESGLIWDIGKYVVEQACRFVSEITGRGWHDFVMAINISPRQFQHPDFMSFITAACEKYNISTANIELEITEGLLMDNTEHSVTMLRRLSDAGFKISIDDFGTGYSSLAYLRKFPLDTLKIDRSFVIDLPENPDAIAVSRAIIGLAHSLRLHVVAEGVETQEQMDFLSVEGCEYIQGYLVSKPIPSSDFMAWLEAYACDAIGSE